MRRHPNLSLAISLAVAARSVARALAAAEEVLKSLGGGAEKRKGLLEAIKRYASRARSYLASLLSDEFIAHSLFSLEAADVGEIDVERYWHVVHAARTVGRSAQWSEGFLGRSRQFLLPSTKIYELYVYAALVKALEGKYGRGAPKGRLALRIGTSKLFFNHYPGDLSRVIARITGAVPSPDIFYLDERLAAPVECKYRELEGLRLRLGDAERLLSYLADSSRDERLKAVVVSLAALETRCVRASINGKEVEVCFAEVDPDKGEAKDQAERVLSLLTS
jgi:Holliday junction resolvase